MADDQPSSFFTPISPFLSSPKFINKKLSDNLELSCFSPVSVLEIKNSTNPSPQAQVPDSKQPTEAIGLALIYSIHEENKNGSLSKPVNRTALLKIQIPAIPPPLSPAESPNSLTEFGIKTRSPQFKNPFSRSRDLIRQLSIKEMELHEDYTRVITHGPNPKTTHIFDECIVEKGCDDDRTSSSLSFFSFCDYCKEILRQDRDVYVYRGEKAFCSEECRFEEMMHLEGTKKPELN